MRETFDSEQFVHWFRHASPYINAHRGRTFVILLEGDTIASAQFPDIVHDIALLDSLGVKLCLVLGARPQIEARINDAGIASRLVNGVRITDGATLPLVKEAIGRVHMEVEAMLSMGLANSPMAGARLRAASGNFVTARPYGVRNGIDYCHTGEVRRVDAEAIRHHLHRDEIVLLSSIGYSPTGEIFNLTAEDVATAIATELKADKLLLLTNEPGVTKDQELLPHLTLSAAQQLLVSNELASDTQRHYLLNAAKACAGGVRRTHIFDGNRDGALLLELFTRNGIGTLITADRYDALRRATIDDVGGILELIEPLERDGILVRRSRERLEMEIDHFAVMERDGMIIACSAIYPFPQDFVAELACLAVHPDYRREGRAQTLLNMAEQFAVKKGVQRLFVLTARTAHWFLEHGFEEATLTDLPVERQAMYNYQRRSKVFIKKLTSTGR